MAIHEAPVSASDRTELYGELLAEGSFIDETVFGSLANWRDELVWHQLERHTDYNRVHWDETAVRRLSYERFHRAWGARANSSEAEPDHLVFCRFIANNRAEGKFTDKVDGPELDNRGEL